METGGEDHRRSAGDVTGTLEGRVCEVGGVGPPCSPHLPHGGSPGVMGGDVGRVRSAPLLRRECRSSEGLAT